MSLLLFWGVDSQTFFVPLNRFGLLVCGTERVKRTKRDVLFGSGFIMRPTVLMLNLFGRD